MSTTPIVTMLNRAWQAIQRNHPDVPGVMIVTGRRRHKSEASTRGSHCAEQWHVEGQEGRRAEVWISGERLAEGAEAVFQTLLHEAVHALAAARGLKDTSNRGRYHNKTFVKLAGEMGLEGPAASGGPHLGYSDCQITADTLQVYKYEVDQLASACKSFVTPAVAEGKAPRKPQAKAYCECPEPDNEINWTKQLEKKLQAHGVPPVLCGICRQAFMPEDEPEIPADRALLRRLLGEEP